MYSFSTTKTHCVGRLFYQKHNFLLCHHEAGGHINNSIIYNLVGLNKETNPYYKSNTLN